MEDRGRFTYRKHTVEYRIGFPMGKHVNDWRLPVMIRIDKGDWLRYIGTIPVRLPEIKKMARHAISY